MQISFGRVLEVSKLRLMREESEKMEKQVLQDEGNGGIIPSKKLTIGKSPKSQEGSHMLILGLSVDTAPKTRLEFFTLPVGFLYREASDLQQRMEGRD